MSKREYFLQKGLQMQRLDEQISSAPSGGNASREVAKYRELCPPATPDIQIQKLIAQCKGDAQRMENAISELWEDYRGNDQDAWATVSKKSTKKKQEQTHSSSQRSYSKTQHQQDDADAPQDGDAQGPRSLERFSTRGRGSMRGRGMASSRGGRGGRGGRGRGGAVVATGSTRGPRNGDNEEESPENDSNSTDSSTPSNDTRGQPSSKTAKDSKRDRSAKTTTKTTTTQPAAQVPPVVYPVLTGAWTKKLNVTGVTSKPKPVEPAPTSAPAPTPAPASAPKTAEKPTAPVTETETAAATATPEAPKTTSPKKTQQEKKSKKTQKFSTTDAVEEATVVVDKTETVKIVEKVASPKASPKKTMEKKTKTVDTTVETTSSNIAAGWGALDVATSTMTEWSSSAPATEPKKASTPNAWGRGSPVLSPPASKEAASTPKSPVAEARPTVVPGSPKDIDAPRSAGSASTSPRPYLKMGKWDSAATPNLSLQFGSFSLNGVDTLEPSSEVGWGSTTTTTTTSNSNSGGKTITKTTTTQSAWGTSTKPASPKKTLSPDRSEQQQQRAQEVTTTKATTSAPPGLSVDSGRVTPTTGQSPRRRMANTQWILVVPLPHQRPVSFPLDPEPRRALALAAVLQLKSRPSLRRGYGYYQNPQFAQYSPRTQYPPRGNMPYGVEGPVPGFSNPPNMPYQDQHMMAQQHEYAGAVPQGFGEINAAYMQQAPMQQQGGHHGHHGHQSGPQGHGKGGSGSGAGGSGSQQSHGQRGNASMQGYQNAGGRDHVSPPVPNASAAMTGSYGQHYGWAGNYGAQPVGGWGGHMMPQGYQQSPSQQQQVPQQQQQQQQQQQPSAHQQSYHQYGNGGAQAGNNANDVNQARWSSS
ncbi:hypothetical protein AM587_10009661 [Phytophthora nicotianae]|uniref:Uncharacterized protein n=1 Tax=Phytophthora nicotianae TaxID=4792 RepID=A0A0W8CHM9_PHYNI|nr:hypothetical protein AM587_10009661 [Phytophthora nicotianae]